MLRIVHNQNDSDGEDIIYERLEHVAVEEEEAGNEINHDEYSSDDDNDGSIGEWPEVVEAEEDEEGNDSDLDDYSSDDDRGVEYIGSDDEDAVESEEGALTLDEVKQSMKSKML